MEFEPYELGDSIIKPEVPAFSFAEFTTIEEEEADENERQTILKEEVEETLRLAASITNDSLPEFLWTPIINDFDNDFQYIKLGVPSVNAILQAAAQLKRKYADYHDWVDALAIWREYHDWVEEEYGSWDAFLEASEEGLISIPVKLEPQLKKTKANKGLRNLTVPLSRINDEDAASREEIMMIINAVDDHIEIYEDDVEYYKKLYKLNAKIEREAAAEYRIRNMYQQHSRMSADPRTDAIMQFLRGETKTDYQGIQHQRSLLDDVEAMHEHDFEDPAIVQDSIGQLSRSIRVDGEYGIYMDRSDEEASILYTALAAAGYDVSLAIEGSGMKKEAKKMIRQQLAMTTGEYSDKKLKKLKKARKRANKALEERLMGDEVVRNILTKNRINFERDDALLNFTMDDILRSD